MPLKIKTARERQYNMNAHRRSISEISMALTRICASHIAADFSTDVRNKMITKARH